ncbi:hypothetical protein CGH99_24025 [Vibrio parahaemolyticus]|nr:MULTISPECIES: restriction endonuclease [Vibrio]ARN65097.1 Dinucleotide-utilizing enzymes involved in molybdopterin and thiamine biosynthesis family 2 [Vibrio vulnificus]TOL32758.1 hypothetical protein CGH99_24025 [Vibrio parahaemolyticus]TOL67999.1 hypothetical protein CGH92_20245 [Vibrio parahaemolyticus]TOO67409.1 hypothetical protein CGH32_16970 [Vibrio parahaemolyticus]
MFLFYHSDQDSKNVNYHKGVLFEGLLKDYLDQVGYVVELRKKNSSLEYDLEGTARATGQKIIGEAKAHSKSMSGQIISSFVGKILPLGLLTKEVHGLFLSISPLTPDAEDYLSTVEHLGVTTSTGQKLYGEVSEALDLPTDKSLEKVVNNLGYDLLVPNILKTDTGVFKLLILKLKNSGTPSAFAIFNSCGELLSDRLFCEALRDNLPELAGFDFVEAKQHASSSDNKHVREIVKGLSVGTDWADYRLPAGPNVFVGRHEFVDKISKHINNNDIPHVIQIKSRSGVGKSSVISFIEQKFSDAGNVTELHDSRDVKTFYDVFSLLARLTGKDTIPTNYNEVDQYLIELNKSLHGKKAIFFVDQFESTFLNPDIYECYEYIANAVTRIGGNLYVIFARKNDQLTTYDDTKVSLTRLNSMSKSYTLPDFERDESILLLDKINENNNNILGREILPYIIEFAQGFPWLLKRTIAHVLKLTNQGDSQKELINAGLKLHDLFEEELEGLDEIEKDYLTKIAAKLPADFKELQVHFDEDPILVKVLDKLTASRLVRLSGSTYDTYNDVFKEYLVYEKLPEFRPLTIYRMYPSTLLSQFHKLVNLSRIDIATMSQELDVSEGYAFNTVKECRNLDLLESSKSSKGCWVIPTNVKDIYSQGLLAGYLRRKIMDNVLVETIVSGLMAGERISESDIPDMFSRLYPYIDASDKTWGQYSTVLKSWLLSLKIIEIEKNGNLKLTGSNHSDVSRELGNLKQISSYRAGNKGLFFPVTSYSMMIQVTEELLKGNEITGKEQAKAKADLKNAGVLVGDQLAVSNTKELEEALIAQLQDPGYKDLWDAINNGQQCLEIFTKIVGEGLKESTIRWRIRKVTSLAKKLNLIPNKRFKY